MVSEKNKKSTTLFQSEMLEKRTLEKIPILDYFEHRI